MEFLNFSNKNNVLVIESLSEEVNGLLSNSDLYVGVRVMSNGFTGANDLWLYAPDIHRFCNALRQLEETRSGEAKLASISPGELELTVKSIDSRGHMAVVGKTGYEIIGENGSFTHSVEFGFEIDPSQLVMALRNDLVKQFFA